MKRELPVYAQVTSRGWLRRTIRISGRIKALVEYDGIGVGICGEFGWGEIVRVDGREVRAIPSRIIGGSEVLDRMLGDERLREWRRSDLWSKHRLRATLGRGRGPLELQIQLTRSGVVTLNHFKATCGLEVMYEEQDGQPVTLRQPPPLPLPASRPSQDLSSLPIAPEDYTPSGTDT